MCMQVGKMDNNISKADIGAKADREIGKAAAGKADTSGRLDTSSTSQKSGENLSQSCYDISHGDAFLFFPQRATVIPALL